MMGLEITIAQHAAESPGHFFPEQQGAQAGIHPSAFTVQKNQSAVTVLMVETLERSSKCGFTAPCALASGGAEILQCVTSEIRGGI